MNWELLLVVIIVAAAVAIIVYASVLVVKQIRRGEPILRSLRGWLKNVFEAIWGL